MWRITTIQGAGSLAVLPQIDAVFFAAAATQNFRSKEERAAYHALWLDRYRQHCPDEFLVTLGEDGAVAGYLAGTLFSNREPLPGPDYYGFFPAELAAAYPAHLHVNIRAEMRGQGIGAALVEAFGALCRKRGISGLHAVTAEGSRAAAFFTRCGLTERARADWRGRRLAFLARAVG